MFWLIIAFIAGVVVGAFVSIAYMEENYDVYEKE